ncbi:MAG: hypothetical protein CSA65_09300 [Proteobacteria bacterium]|nr:MAG: hypothetical protein CSA65_09300 [Pseudomonadota bacterium]
MRRFSMLGSLPLLFAFALFGCAEETSPKPHVQKPTVHQKAASKAASEAPSKASSEAPSKGAAMPLAKSLAKKPPRNGHDLKHPPIDCPLRKAGIDPGKMRPFAQVSRYIAFLERKDRAAWQKPDAVVAALKLRGDETVADLGAGSGYFAFRFAKALPRGKVIAADIEPEMIRHIHHKAVSEGVRNLEATVLKPGLPALPKGLDLVFICDVLHHVLKRPRWLKHVVASLAPGGRLALIEFKAGKLPEGPPEKLKIPRRELIALAKGAGLTLAADHGKLLPYQSYLVFRRPSP